MVSLLFFMAEARLAALETVVHCALFHGRCLPRGAVHFVFVEAAERLLGLYAPIVYSFDRQVVRIVPRSSTGQNKCLINRIKAKRICKHT